MGANNLLIVDGLFFARSLNSDYTLYDPLNKLAYAVHSCEELQTGGGGVFLRRYLRGDRSIGTTPLTAEE